MPGIPPPTPLPLPIFTPLAAVAAVAVVVVLLLLLEEEEEEEEEEEAEGAVPVATPPEALGKGLLNTMDTVVAAPGMVSGAPAMTFCTRNTLLFLVASLSSFSLRFNSRLLARLDS